MANNKKKKKGSGGGDNQNIVLSAAVRGKRNECQVSVALRQGRFVVPDQDIRLRLGYSDSARGPWIMDSKTPPERYVMKTDTDGEKLSDKFDWAGDPAKNFTHVWAVFWHTTKGVFEQSVLLPALDETGDQLTKKSGKRLQFAALEGPLKSPDNRYRWPLLRALNKEGKASAEEVIFTSSEKMTLIDRSTGKPLSYNRKSARKTTYFLYKTPSTGLVLIDCQLEGVLNCTAEVVHVESGETASLTMEFDY